MYLIQQAREEVRSADLVVGEGEALSYQEAWPVHHGRGLEVESDLREN